MNSMINGFDGDTASLSDEQRALIVRRDKVLGPAYRLFYNAPIEVVRGEGVWLFDAAGNRYLDAYNNVASIGHCHPRVVDAMARQSAILNTHTRYLSELTVSYAEALLGHFPPELEHVMFTCTGSEANDLALRIARIATGAEGVIVTANAYHGITELVAGLSPAFGPGNRMGRNIWTVPAPTSGEDEAGSQFAAGVERAIAEMRDAGVAPAALLIDTIFSSDGVFTEPLGFLQAAVALVRAAGGLFIADEVQAGFARTGSSMWGFERHGLVPDLVTMGKPMGNGYPVAAVVGAAEAIAAFARSTRYFNTFGGNSVACAAAQAVLDVIEIDNLRHNSSLIGQSIIDGIRSIAARHNVISDIRGAGLFIGVELGEADERGTILASKVVNAMREHGVLISAAGPFGNTLKIRPPLVFDSGNADMLLNSLEAAMNAL